MKNFFAYLDLPVIPDSLLEDLQFIIDKPPKPNSSIPATYTSFQTRLVNDCLAQWSKSIFGSNSFIQYQIISHGLHIHKDINRNVAFNYLLCTGGPHATTVFFDEQHRPIESVNIAVGRWHKIKTDVFHTVRGLDGQRIAVSVELKDYIWGQDLNLTSSE